MKAAWKLLGALSLASVVSVSSAASSEPPSPAGNSPITDDQVVGTAYSDGSDNPCDDSFDYGHNDFLSYCCVPVWKIRAGALILTRDKPDDVILARPLGGLIQISGGEDFDFGYSAAPDVSIERVLGDGTNSVEVRYFGGLDWNSATDYGNTGDIQIGATNLPLAFDVTSDYFSRLNSTEINLRHEYSDRVTWLAGFRMIELHEKLSYDVDFVVPNLSGVNWNTDNHLYGAQLGADLKLWRLSGPLTVNGIFKGGVYGNDADNSFKYDIVGVPIVTGGANDTPVAFVGEIGVTSAYQLTRHFALRGGYQLLWINEVALASDQAQLALNTLDVDTINSSSNAFYHGALAGGEFTW